MQHSSQLEIKIFPTSYLELTPGTPLQVGYPTCELGAYQSFDVTASYLKILDIKFISLRSSNQDLSFTLKSRLKCRGDRAFCIAAPRFWNAASRPRVEGARSCPESAPRTTSGMARTGLRVGDGHRSPSPCTGLPESAWLAETHTASCPAKGEQVHVCPEMPGNSGRTKAGIGMTPVM